MKIMKFALFLGCNIPARLTQYEDSARAVLGELGVELAEIKAFNCCGYPVRNIDFKSFLLSSARNLALAEKKGLDVISLCKCCYGSLKKADHLMKEDVSWREEINKTLEREGLSYGGEIHVKHLLSVLFHDVGLEAIKGKIARSFDGLQIAAQYGCHVLRPSKVVEFDDPVSPTIFDQLVELTGARSVDWPSRLECCGAPLWGINDELSMDLTQKKLVAGKEAGADCICTACTYCQIQFDTVQAIIHSSRGTNHPLPAILYPQLLGLCMELDRESLGLGKHQLPAGNLEDFFESKDS
jgi:heterodisulfide reductase subunit B